MAQFLFLWIRILSLASQAIIVRPGGAWTWLALRVLSVLLWLSIWLGPPDSTVFSVTSVAALHLDGFRDRPPHL